MSSIVKKILGDKKDDKVKPDDIVIKEVDLGRTIKLPNGEVIEKQDILQITPDGLIVYVSRDGQIKTSRLFEQKTDENRLNISLV